MNTILEHEKQIILKVFENLSNDYWKTLHEISDVTKISKEDVYTIITHSGDFVVSSQREKYGEPVYTLRRIFEKRAPFMEKLIAAFKNRGA